MFFAEAVAILIEGSRAKINPANFHSERYYCKLRSVAHPCMVMTVGLHGFRGKWRMKLLAPCPPQAAANSGPSIEVAMHSRMLDINARPLRTDEPSSDATGAGGGMPRRVWRLSLGLRRAPAAQRASEAVMGVAGDGVHNRRDRDAGWVSVGGRTRGSLRARGSPL